MSRINSVTPGYSTSEPARWGEDVLGALVKLAGMWGFDDIATNVANKLTGKPEVSLADVEETLGAIIAEAKAKGTRALNRLNDQLYKLQNMVTSPQSRQVIANALADTRDKLNIANKNAGLAESYEKANAALTTELSSMNRYDRTASRGRDIIISAMDNAKKAADIYDNIEKEVK